MSMMKNKDRPNIEVQSDRNQQIKQNRRLHTPSIRSQIQCQLLFKVGASIQTSLTPRFADDPEFTSDADLTPTNRANFRSKSFANRPVVNQASSAESTTEQMSSGPITLPETGTEEVPGTNSFTGKAAA
jgi:hypothetical protein